MNAPITEAETILATAIERGRAKNLPYAGEVTPQEAHRLMVAHGAIIVDVRSAAETNFVGRVPGALLIEWKHWPSGDFNPQFLPELKRQSGPDDILLFLCRSAVRSHAAATTATEARMPASSAIPSDASNRFRLVRYGSRSMTAATRPRAVSTT